MSETVPNPKTINDFCFVVFSYNQEEYVFENLESIKFLITEYSKDKKIQLIFSDDCSSDSTVKRARYWIEKNTILFNEYYILEHKENVGIIQNMIDGTSLVNAKLYKGLACDDLFFKNNIFECCSDEKIIITPTIQFTKQYIIQPKMFPNYDIFLSKRNKNIKDAIKRMLNYNYCIPSPGVVLPVSVWKDDSFIEYISRYRYIEDVLEWNYLLNKDDFNFKIKIEDKPIVMYRTNVGVSANFRLNGEINEEYKRIRKEIPSRRELLPKIINPYVYFHFFYTRMCKLISNKKQMKEFLVGWKDNIAEAKPFLKFIQDRAEIIERQYSMQQRNNNAGY